MSASHAVSVNELLQRQIPLEWYESVALISGLCAVLAEKTLVPDAEEVFVTADGAVLVHNQGGGHEVVALARMLNALLEGASPPAPLRLFALDAISSAVHKTPTSFGEALAYYERPGRADLIKAVYQRFSGTPADLPHSAVDPLILDDKKPAPPKRARRNMRPWLTASAALVLASGGVALWVVASRTSALSQRRDEVTTLVTRLGTAAQKVTGVVMKQLGLGVPPEKVAEKSDTPAPQVREARRRTTRPTAGDDRGVPIEPERADPTPVTTAVVDTAEPVESDERGKVDGIDIIRDATIYSIATSDVRPPVLLGPQRPPDSVRVSGQTVANALELLITETGVVQRVRMLSPPARMPDMMLLSAAKNWKFQPALKDGRPVSYRLTFNWVSNLR